MNSHEWTVSDSLPCATKVAFLDSPKDFTSERIDSFLGKSLRSPRGNFFTPFECFFAPGGENVVHITKRGRFLLFKCTVYV